MEIICIAFYNRKGDDLKTLKEIGETLKKIRSDKGYTQEQLAEAVGMTQKSISLYERGSNNMSIKAAKKIADVLNISHLYLLGEAETPFKSIDKIPLDNIYKKTIPVYGYVGAGGGKTTLEEPIGTINSYEGDFGVVVKGDSMFPIPENAIAVVKKVYDFRDVKNGSLVVVRINGDEAMIKYWDIEEDYGVLLRSQNPNYRPKFYPWQKFHSGECELLGLVLQIILDTRTTNYYSQ